VYIMKHLPAAVVFIVFMLSILIVVANGAPIACQDSTCQRKCKEYDTWCVKVGTSWEGYDYDEAIAIVDYCVEVGNSHKRVGQLRHRQWQVYPNCERDCTGSDNTTCAPLNEPFLDDDGNKHTICFTPGSP
jgi:hypothetical protein